MISYNLMRQYIQLISNGTAPTPIDLWQVRHPPTQFADNYAIGYSSKRQGQHVRIIW